MAPRPLLLIVDDEPSIIPIVERLARSTGFDVETCTHGRQALAALETRKPDIAMVDLRMPEIDGLAVLRAIREADPGCQVVLMTGHASIDSAIEAIKLGAMDYLSKPFDVERMQRLLSTAREDIERRQAVLAAEGDVAKRLEFCGMIGRSAAMQELFHLIRRLAPHVRTALISGETGTGKELVARALHKLGPRPSKRFISINCSAVVETLFESELFGHVRGAFTGATENKPGLFEAADGGTLFLDEVGELPTSVQAKLLRVLETGEVQRVGALEGRRVDVRIVAATNRDLRTEADGGRFRSDLFYRLNIVELRLPPLRDRREDVPYLTASFVREFADRFGKSVSGLTPAAERLLLSGGWGGNVRELRNTIERACILSEGKLLTERELISCLAPTTARPAPSRYEVPLLSDCQQELDSVQRDHICRVLEKTGGNKKAAAQLLGVSRRALYRKLDRLGLRDRSSTDGSPDSFSFDDAALPVGEC